MVVYLVWDQGVARSSRVIPTNKRAFSSAGSERLPSKQRVGGSNPSTPTQEDFGLPFFVYLKIASTAFMAAIVYLAAIASVVSMASVLSIASVVLMSFIPYF